MSKDYRRLEALVSTADAAKMLGVSQVAVQTMVRDGRLPGIKVARNYVIPRDALVAFARQYVPGPGPRMKAAQKLRTLRSRAKGRN